MNNGAWKIVATLDDEADGVVAVWWGGPYVNLYAGAQWNMIPDPVPYDVVNVWNYADGRPEISTGDEVLQILRDYAARCMVCGLDRDEDCDEYRCKDCDGPCSQCSDND